MFYRHLHAESCELSRVGEEAPKSELQALRAEYARLRGAVESFHNSIPAYSKKKLHGLQGEYWSPAGMMIDTELIANLYAALQPERCSHD